MVVKADGAMGGASVVVLVNEAGGAPVVVSVDGTEAGTTLTVLALHWCFDMQVGQNQRPHAPHVCRYPGLCPHREHFLPLFFFTGSAAAFASCNGCRLLVGAWTVVHGGETHGVVPGKLNWIRSNTVSARWWPLELLVVDLSMRSFCLCPAALTSADSPGLSRRTPLHHVPCAGADAW